MAEKIEDSFLEVHVGNMRHQFWCEEKREVLFSQIELRYHTDIIRHWAVVDIISNGDHFLIKWVRRIFPLSDEQLKEDYGR